MPYTPSTWSVGDPLYVTRLNNLETQYAQVFTDQGLITNVGSAAKVFVGNLVSSTLVAAEQQLHVFGVAGWPDSSGSTPSAGIGRFGVGATNVLDVGIDGVSSAAWIQSYVRSNMALVRPLCINPNASLTSDQSFWVTVGGRTAIAYFGIVGSTATNSSNATFGITQTWNDVATTHRGVEWVFTETGTAATSTYLRVLGGAAGATVVMSLTTGGALAVAGSVAWGGGSAISSSNAVALLADNETVTGQYRFTASRAGDFQTYIINSSATGNGLFIQGGDTTQRALSVNNYADTAELFYVTPAATVVNTGNFSINATTAQSNLTSTGVNQPMTAIAASNVFFSQRVYSSGIGGMTAYGLTDSDGVPISFYGVHGNASPTMAALTLGAGKTNGTNSWTALASGEIVLSVVNFSTTLLQVFGDGGIVSGAATGGSKGAGTANFAGDIYKNNTAYTNPDYVFEHWATGRIVKFAKNEGAARYRGLLPLSRLERHVRKHHRFPQIASRPTGAFARADISLELLEQAHLYLFDHERRLAALEARMK